MPSHVTVENVTPFSPESLKRDNKMWNWLEKVLGRQSEKQLELMLEDLNSKIKRTQLTIADLQAARGAEGMNSLFVSQRLTKLQGDLSDLVNLHSTTEGKLLLVRQGKLRKGLMN